MDIAAWPERQKVSKIPLLLSTSSSFLPASRSVRVEKQRNMMIHGVATRSTPRCEVPAALTSAPRRLLSYGDGVASGDVNNGTFALLQQVFQPLCSAALGCTCFGGGAVLQRPVCGSTWASCDGDGVLTGCGPGVMSRANCRR
jgi:hypothetical protein